MIAAGAGAVAVIVTTLATAALPGPGVSTTSATAHGAPTTRVSKHEGQVSGVDPDATFTKKNGHSYFG